MHNWRLLLLAFLAIFQPISTFTKRDHVDGRQQCSNRPLLRDTEHLYGSYRSSKVASQERLNHRETGKLRLEHHRYEVRDIDSLTPTAGRRNFADREREVARRRPEQARFARAQYSDREDRERLSDTRDRVTHLDRARNSREDEDRRISVTDSNRRERVQEISRERNARVSRNVHEDSRDCHKSTDRLSDVKRGECSFKNERTWLSVDDRREARRTRVYIGQPKKAEIRDARITLNRQRDQVTRRESSRNREVSRIQERIGQEYRRIISIRDLRHQPKERRSPDTISEHNRRSSSLNRELERREARDENRAGADKNLAHRERPERSTIDRDAEDRQTRFSASAVRTNRNNNKESRIDSQEEQSKRIKERDSVRFESRNSKNEILLPNRKAQRNDERSVSEQESQIIRGNNRDTERRETSSDGRIESNRVIRKTEKSRSRENRHAAGVDSRRSRESNIKLDQREVRTNERLDFSRVTTRDNQMKSNRFSRSAERIASLELRRDDPQTFRENSRDMQRRERRINERLDTSRDGHIEFRRLDSRRIIEQYSSRQERRSNDRLNNRDGVQLSQSDLGVRRVYTRRTNEQRQGDSHEEINVSRENRINSNRQGRTAERVTTIEARRVDSRNNNERDSGGIRENYRNTARRESRTVDPVPNSESRSVYSRRHNEPESDRIRLNNRDIDRSESRTAYRGVDSEIRRGNSKTGSDSRNLETSRDTARSERRSNDRVNDVRRPSQSSERVADLEFRRVDFQRRESRRFRDSNRNMERRESRTSDRFHTSLDSLNFVTKSANRVANLENRRIESRNINNRESQRIHETREISRVAKSKSSRYGNKHFEARNIKGIALERDGIEARIRSKVDVTTTRDYWSLNEKDVEDSKPFIINWQYVFYTLQGIYLSSMLLQVLGFEKKKDGSHSFWESAQKLIKVD